jgi:hypothetical protein
MTDDGLVDDLAAFLYHLTFPRKDYKALPDSVKVSYINDAEKIASWFMGRYTK